MKAALDLILVFVSMAVLIGCGERKHVMTRTTAYIGGDGQTNRVETVDFESSIALKGSKMELSDLELTESVTKDGWNYGVGASNVSASPESVILGPLLVETIKQASAVAQQYFGASQSNNGDQLTSEELTTLREVIRTATATSEDP